MAPATPGTSSLSLHDALPIWQRRAMIVVHHLNDSRSMRILWLMEELGRREPGLQALVVLDLVGQPEIKRSEEHTSELQSPVHLVCRLLLEKKERTTTNIRARN